jgi:hypothetical protein
VKIRVVWTHASIAHIARHGVTREEVNAALAGHQYIRSAKGRIVVIAESRSRALFIVLDPIPSEPGCAELASARPAERSEKRLLRRRGKG